MSQEAGLHNRSAASLGHPPSSLWVSVYTAMEPRGGMSYRQQDRNLFSPVSSIRLCTGGVQPVDEGTPSVPAAFGAFCCLGEISQLFSFGFLLHQRPQVFLGQVRVSHRRRQVRVAHCFLDVHRILPFGQPCGHPSMPQIMLVEIERELGPSCG